MSRSIVGSRSGRPRDAMWPVARAANAACFVTLSLSVGMGAILSSHAQAENIRITATGTVSLADEGMGFTIGQPVTFFWEVNDFAPQQPVGSAGGSYRWEDEEATDPQLYASVGGTGISGTYQRAPDDAPYDVLITLLNRMRPQFAPLSRRTSIPMD
jgi:hypothetical protein